MNHSRRHPEIMPIDKNTSILNGQIIIPFRKVNFKQNTLGGTFKNESKSLTELKKHSEIFYQNKVYELMQIISNLKDNSKNSIPIIEKLEIIENEILNLKNQYTYFSEKLERLPEKMQSNNPENDIFDKLNSVDLRLSSVINEISGSKIQEIQNGEKMKLLALKTEDLTTSNLELVKRFSYIDGEIKDIKTNQDKFLGNLDSTLNHKMDEISEMNKEIKERVDSLERNQELLFTKLTDKTNRKFIKLIKKLQKTEKLPNRSRIVRLLRKKLALESFDNVLILSDKRNLSFSSLLFDVARKINYSTVLLMIDSRKLEEKDETLRKMIRGKDLILVTTKIQKKNFENLRKYFGKNEKLVLVKKSLRFDFLSNRKS